MVVGKAAMTMRGREFIVSQHCGGLVGASAGNDLQVRRKAQCFCRDYYINLMWHEQLMMLDLP